MEQDHNSHNTNSNSEYKFNFKIQAAKEQIQPKLFDWLTKMIISTYELPITVAARSEAWTVFAPSNTGIVGSNPTQDMDIFVHLLGVQLASLRRADPSYKESYGLCKMIKTLKNS
jgi:hypothetical protein